MNIITNKDFYCVYLLTVNNSVFLNAVIRKDSPRGNVLFSRSLDLIHDVLSEGEVNARLNATQRAQFERALSSDYIRNEIRLLNDRCPVDATDSVYGVSLFHCDDVLNMFDCDSVQSDNIFTLYDDSDESITDGDEILEVARYSCYGVCYELMYRDAQDKCAMFAVQYDNSENADDILFEGERVYSPARMRKVFRYELNSFKDYENNKSFIHAQFMQLIIDNM